MSKPVYRIEYWVDEPGREVSLRSIEFDSYEEMSSFYDSQMGMTRALEGMTALGPDGTIIKTRGQIQLERDRSKDLAKRKEEALRNAERMAEIENDPIERLVAGAMKWSLIAVGVAFVVSVIQSV